MPMLLKRKSGRMIRAIASSKNSITIIRTYSIDYYLPVLIAKLTVAETIPVTGTKKYRGISSQKRFEVN
jgi:hypothetical protein